MNILPEVYLVGLICIVKLLFIFKNKINNPLLFVFLGFEIVALLPALVVYSNDILVDPSSLRYEVSAENIRAYLLIYLMLQICFIYFTNHRFVWLLKNLASNPIKFSVRNIVFLNVMVTISSILFLSGISVFIVIAIALNTFIGLLQARIAVYLISNNIPIFYSLICLVCSGPAYTIAWYALGMLDDLSRLALVWPFIIYLLLGWCMSRLSKSWIVVFAFIFLTINTLQTIVGGGDFLVVKHGINVVAAVEDNKVTTDLGHLLYNTGYQFIAPVLGLGIQNNTANAIYQRHFYNLSEEQISASWGIGITMPADLILSFGIFGSLLAIVVLSLSYRGILKAIFGINLLNNQWGVPLHLYLVLRLFAALRMDMSYLTATLLFDIVTLLLIFSKTPRFIR